ncbi:hypothetical protein LR48_Vigan11g066800 [Vigna angularis]|uniref:Uncharacterized protein n=1 Tax=Phaseolus angularis TaxID=3914 RepID=A0A0L9VRE0_PHAAN|nr:hypothetical protein LR48_Vigan11g066800 [Vigna angularis]
MNMAIQSHHHSSLGHTRGRHHQPRSQSMTPLLSRCGTCTILCRMLGWLPLCGMARRPTEEGGRAEAAKASAMDEDAEDEDDDEAEDEEFDDE